MNRPTEPTWGSNGSDTSSSGNVKQRQRDNTPEHIELTIKELLVYLKETLSVDLTVFG